MTLCYAQNINSNTSAAASVIFEKNEKKPEEGAEAKVFVFICLLVDW